MKKNVLILSALCFATMTLVFSGCKKETNDPQEPAKVQTYQMSIQASKGANDNQANGPRRVIELGDGEETLTATWRTGDRVYVYNVTTGQELSGYLEAADNLANTQLNGSLSGTVSVGNELLLKYQPNPSYADQEGTLEYISGHCDYATATVTVATVNGGLITTTTNATFDNQQAIVKFTLDDGNGNTLSPTALTINNGADIATLAIPAETYTTNGDGVLYVAIPATSANLTLTATAADGTYIKAVTGSNATLANGEFYRITLSMTKQTALPEGALKGEFKISSTKKIHFAKGNLQYDSDTQTWQFAENQWTYIGGESGVGNRNVTEDGIPDNSGIVDMFGWVGASSAWTDTDIRLYGICSAGAINGGDYGNVASEALKSDWGTLAITNGGNTPNFGWYTLSEDDWKYLLNVDGSSDPLVGRQSAIRFAKAFLLGTIHGLIIFPDDYTHPDGVAAIAGINNATDSYQWNNNQYNAEDWGKMEAAGAVFLPAYGYRDGTTLSGYPAGYYWTSTSSTSTPTVFGGFSKWLYIKDDKIQLTDYEAYRHRGCFVRLVRDAD